MSKNSLKRREKMFKRVVESKNPRVQAVVKVILNNLDDMTGKWETIREKLLNMKEKHVGDRPKEMLFEVVFVCETLYWMGRKAISEMREKKARNAMTYYGEAQRYIENEKARKKVAMTIGLYDDLEWSDMTHEDQVVAFIMDITSNTPEWEGDFAEYEGFLDIGDMFFETVVSAWRRGDVAQLENYCTPIVTNWMYSNVYSRQMKGIKMHDSVQEIDGPILYNENPYENPKTGLLEYATLWRCRHPPAPVDSEGEYIDGTPIQAGNSIAAYVMRVSPYVYLFLFGFLRFGSRFGLRFWLQSLSFVVPFSLFEGE